MSETISKASVCEILADIYPTDGEKVVAVKEVDKAYEAIQQLPSAQPELIRCKDCKKFEYHRCTRANHYVSEYDHCMSIFGAERRTDADMRGEQDGRIN